MERVLGAGGWRLGRIKRSSEGVWMMMTGNEIWQRKNFFLCPAKVFPKK